MINKSSKQLIKKSNKEPEAIRILRGLSQHEERSVIKSSFKFPYNTIEKTYQDEDIADWSKLKNPFCISETEEPKTSKLNFKTVFKDHKQNRRCKRYNLYLNTLTNESLAQKTSSNSLAAHNKSKVENQPKERPRCALKNIIPDFSQSQNNKQRLQYLNQTKWSSIRGKHSVVAQQKGCLAIRKIKRQLLNGLQTRSKLFSCPHNSSEISTKKNKLCSQINLHLNCQPQSTARRENTPKNLRLASWHNYIKMRCNTIEKCFEVNRDQNLTKVSKNDSIQYRLLKSLLQKEKN